MTEQQFKAKVSFFWARLAGGRKAAFRPDVEYDTWETEEEGADYDVEPRGWIT